MTLRSLPRAVITLCSARKGSRRGRCRRAANQWPRCVFTLSNRTGLPPGMDRIDEDGLWSSPHRVSPSSASTVSAGLIWSFLRLPHQTPVLAFSDQRPPPTDVVDPPNIPPKVSGPSDFRRGTRLECNHHRAPIPTRRCGTCERINRCRGGIAEFGWDITRLPYIRYQRDTETHPPHPSPIRDRFAAQSGPNIPGKAVNVVSRHRTDCGSGSVHHHTTLPWRHLRSITSVDGKERGVLLPDL
jgi:hypothetical protein